MRNDKMKRTKYLKFSSTTYSEKTPKNTAPPPPPKPAIQMSNNKQSNDHIPDVGEKVSSVEWYSREIGKITALALSGKMTGLEWKYLQAKALEKAKAMRKQEMIDFADNYVDNCVIPNENMAIPTIMDVPQYYNETQP